MSKLVSMVIVNRDEYETMCGTLARLRANAASNALALAKSRGVLRKIRDKVVTSTAYARVMARSVLPDDKAGWWKEV